jgi:ATP-binding cassette subfamily F protein uup
VVCVVSHDRYFLNRVCTDILAFEGDGAIHHSVGDYDYYLEKKRKRRRSHRAPDDRSDAEKNTGEPSGPAGTAPKPAKPGKLSFKDARELEGIEPQILAVEQEIARIEGLFASPDFHRTHATQTNELLAELAAAKEKLPRLYARWEELEALKNSFPPLNVASRMQWARSCSTFPRQKTSLPRSCQECLSVWQMHSQLLRGRQDLPVGLI